MFQSYTRRVNCEQQQREGKRKLRIRKPVGVQYGAKEKKAPQTEQRKLQPAGDD